MLYRTVAFIMIISAFVADTAAAEQKFLPHSAIYTEKDTVSETLANQTANTVSDTDRILQTAPLADLRNLAQRLYLIRKNDAKNKKLTLPKPPGADISHDRNKLIEYIKTLME